MSSRDHPDWWKNVGGQNSQDSILERRSLIWNDDGIVDGTLPANFYSGIEYKGKFYTRGCRGMLESLQVYCIGDGFDNLTIRYSPHPCLGPFDEIMITPGVAWAWQNFVIEEMWNYDSLFIWIHDCEANVDWAYDAVEPYDGHLSPDFGATWRDMAIRPFIRAIYTGETPGDVPVSGIINNIPIPSTGAVVVSQNPVNVPNNLETLITYLEGSGTMLMASIWGHDYVVPNHLVVRYQMHIYADGVLALTVDNMDMTQSPIAGAGRSSMGEFLNYLVGDDPYFRMNLRIPIDFRRYLSVHLTQTSGAAMTIDGSLSVNTVGSQTC